MLREVSRLVLGAPKKVIYLSYWVFAAWWVAILLVHMVTCLFNAFYAYCYWNLDGTYLNLCLEFYQIGMPHQHHRTIAIVHAIVAVIHGMCLALMLAGSLHDNSLAFTPWSSSTAGGKTKRRSSSGLLQSFTQAYNKITYPCGLCGVNGKYFDAALVCREVVETALQTVQAYRMSVLLPRTLLNRVYVVLVAFNCWSSFVADSVFFGRDEARRRFACIVLDGMLDLIACTGVQLLILLNYVHEYNPELRGFDESIWYNDEWVARALNEFRMVMIVSWSDLISRTIFSLGLVITTTSMKRLLFQLPRKENRIAQSTSSIVIAVGATRKLLKGNKRKKEGAWTIEKPSQQLELGALIRARLVTCRNWLGMYGDRILLRGVHLFFGAWGVIVLVLHIHASLQPTLPQCFMQVRPWAVSRPSCYLVGLDCHILGIAGKKNEVHLEWSEFDASTVVQLLIRHCPTLEVPNTFQKFSGLHGIKVYNTTITDWGESAAITTKTHPQLTGLFLVRVNMTGGLLPAGFQSTDFPQSLNDIEICVTNLQSLPDDLATKWPSGGIIYVEYSQLRAVPPVLAQVQPSYLSLAGNPMTRLPPDIFEVPSLLYLGISEMDLEELPRNVTNLGAALSRIYMSKTAIAFFWSWMDDFAEQTKGKIAPVRAASSTYCNDFENLQKGTGSGFRVPLSPEYSEILMNSAIENRQEILKTVSCSTKYEGLLYPLSFDDSINAISVPPRLVRHL